MNREWVTSQAWIAYFDILGFKSIINHEKNSLTLEIFKKTLTEVIDDLKEDVSEFETNIGYLFYADTFIIYSKSKEINDYPALMLNSKKFITNCILKRLAIRGAISFGEVEELISSHNKILIGKAFLESHLYNEDQNWLGLILCPSASQKLKKVGLDPIRHGFINRDIPMRKYSIFDDRIYAYRFINGSTNFECPMLRILEEMKHYAPKEEKVKYENTIMFIKKYYTVHKSS